MKNKIKLTESDLHRIIRSCVNEALNEIGDTHPQGAYGFFNDAADKAMAQGRTRQGKNFRNYARKRWNDEYAYEGPAPEDDLDITGMDMDMDDGNVYVTMGKRGVSRPMAPQFSDGRRTFNNLFMPNQKRGVKNAVSKGLANYDAYAYSKKKR